MASSPEQQFSPHLPSYAELHCLSNFSFLRGASHAEELVGRAAALGYSALAITDECSLAGIVRAHEAALEACIKLIVGAEFRFALDKFRGRGGAAQEREVRDAMQFAVAGK